MKYMPFIVTLGVVLVMGCGNVVCTGETQYGNGTELPIAIETGGRETPVYAEITVEAASAKRRG